MKLNWRENISAWLQVKELCIIMLFNVVQTKR